MRPRRAAALALAAVAAGAAATGATHPAVAAGPAAAVPAVQRLVVLLGDRGTWTAPGPAAHRTGAVLGRRPLTGVRTTLPVLGTVSAGGRRWLRVGLPGRPSGRRGWILDRRTRPASTPWHLRVDVSARRVTVFHGGRELRRFRAIVGTRATPTPTGRFFVEEAVAVSPRRPGGPFALATSARSAVLQEFAGGPGQIALHGTTGLAGLPGSAASHGCVRVGTAAITWLAARIGAGVPLTVVP